MTTTATKERPILFSAPMVRALLDGRKTQTRRMVKRGHVFKFCPGGDLSREERSRMNASPFYWERDNPAHPSPEELLTCCPHGVPSDRLWVKETMIAREGRWLYAADGAKVTGPASKVNEWLRSRIRATSSSIHMPRWASRLTLELTDVRAQRVEDITDEDAIAEGIIPFTKDGVVMKFWMCDPCDGPMKCAWKDLPRTPRAAFLELFYGINERAPRGSDPWVWALTFTKR